jgi:hypothetical protein
MSTTLQQGNWQKQWGMLLAQVWSDELLKQRLMSDPAAVLAEYGIEVPEGVELRVVEDTDEVCHLVLPPSPAGDLFDEELTVSNSLICVCARCGRCGCGCRRCGCDAH